MKPCFLRRRPARLVDLGHRIGNFHVEHFRRHEQPLRVLSELEDLPAIGALAFEHRAAIVKRMREHVDLGVLPGYEIAIHPDEALALIEGNDGGHGKSSFARALDDPEMILSERLQSDN